MNLKRLERKEDILLIDGEEFVIKHSSYFPNKKRIFYLADKKGLEYVLVLSKRDYSFFSLVHKDLSGCLLQPIFVLPRITFENETYFYVALYPKGIVLSKSYLGTLDKEVRKEIACSLIGKLQILHSYGFCHGDVKPRNIVLLSKEVFFIDCEHFFNIPYVFSFSGTKRYKLFPENFKFYDYFEELFALICSIFFIFTGKELISRRDVDSINKFWGKYQDLEIEDILALRFSFFKEIYPYLRLKLKLSVSILDWFFSKFFYFMKSGDYSRALRFFLSIDASELLRDCLNRGKVL